MPGAARAQGPTDSAILISLRVAGGMAIWRLRASANTQTETLEWVSEQSPTPKLRASRSYEPRADCINQLVRSMPKKHNLPAVRCGGAVDAMKLTPPSNNRLGSGQCLGRMSPLSARSVGIRCGLEARTGCHIVLDHRRAWWRRGASRLGDEGVNPHSNRHVPTNATEADRPLEPIQAFPIGTKPSRK